MGRIKIQLHFSYILAILLALAYGKLQMLAVYTISMVLHELSHYLVAKRLFYKCTKLQLSAFGAVLYGEFDNARGAEQMAIALAGPLANLAIAVVLVALWWVAPVSYAVTEDFVMSNISMACINLIPAYPLDGGRILLGILQKKNVNKPLVKVKNMALVISLILFAVFLISVFVGVGLYSLGLFAVFLCAGYCIDSNGNYYERISQYHILSRRLRQGVEKKTLIFNSNTIWSKVILRLTGHYLYNIEVIEGGNIMGTIGYTWIDKLIANCPSDTSLGQIVMRQLYRQ